MNVVRKAVTGFALAGAGLVLAVVPAGPALASTGTTVGQTGPPQAGALLDSPNELVQTGAAMPTGGVVTSLNTQAGSCPVAVGSYNLQVLRPLGGGDYTVLGDTGNQTDPCDGQLHSYPVDITVQAGDVLGVYVAAAWEGLLNTSGTVAFNDIPEPAVGDTVSLPNTDPATIDESATLEQDASELAATLVSDAKGLPPGAALSAKATAIQTAVTAGNTPTACAGISNFLGLVKAQTGKKLTTAQAGLLTTDADNLATALSC